jgi:hypothetical protein
MALFGGNNETTARRAEMALIQPRFLFSEKSDMMLKYVLSRIESVDIFHVSLTRTAGTPNSSVNNSELSEVICDELHNIAKLCRNGLFVVSDPDQSRVRWASE